MIYPHEGRVTCLSKKKTIKVSEQDFDRIRQAHLPENIRDTVEKVMAFRVSRKKKNTTTEDDS